MKQLREYGVALACGALLATAGCSDNGTDPMSGDGGGGGGVIETVSFASDVQPIFDANCVGCHGLSGNGGLDLRPGQAWGNLVGQPSTSYAQNRVVEDSPDQSVLYLKMSGAAGVGNSMPPTGVLPAGDVETVRTWIEEGAQDN